MSGDPERIRTDQWHLRYLGVSTAHRISQGEGVTVAVPDSGVDPHPDLSRNLIPGADIVSGGGGSGRQDRDGHGTSMAGLIAAHGQPEQTGALGIAPKSKILPIFSTPPNEYGDPNALARGIDYAIAQGVDVISISSVGTSSNQLQQSVDKAIAANIVIVAAVGNLPRDQVVGHPASREGVVGVGGVDRAGVHAAVSVSGQGVDLTAPAVDIFSTSYGGKYSKGTGTSSATAMVAGAAALVRARFPDLSAAEVVHRLTATAVDKGPPGRDDQYGYGVIDLVAALTADVPPLGSGPSTLAAASSPAPTAAQAGPATGSDDGRAAVRGLVTLGVLVAVGGWVAVVRRRRNRIDPPPRISR
ncbi:type VII secretion-associated serine protease mycosin [Micromonospora endolithica]|uniref:Type VII secretion-associated serine protease mycosin n=1 Tax=Micromonospora endolithica TaxID=230091 RepID=A0A3A9Z8L6_9ACTN|nr:type VII secretion-associated serine protease mycosin [Micromonospora endolithica]